MVLLQTKATGNIKGITPVEEAGGTLLENGWFGLCNVSSHAPICRRDGNERRNPIIRREGKCRISPLLRRSRVPNLSNIFLVAPKFGSESSLEANGLPYRGQHREVVGEPSADTKNSGHSSSCWPHTRRTTTLTRCSANVLPFGRKEWFYVTSQKRMPEGYMLQRIAYDHTYTLCSRPRNRA